MQKGTVIIGLGNVFLHDDAVGLKVVEELRKTPLAENVELKEYEEMDLSLLQEFKDASRLVIVDSMKSGATPGTVSLFTVAEGAVDGERFPSLHELDLAGMVDLARKMGIIACPVTIVGIEPGDLSLGEGLSEAVRSAVPSAAEAVSKQVEGGADSKGMSSGPRLVLIMVNQSSSMGEEMGGYGISMAEGVADVLNLYIQKVTQKRDEDRLKGGSEFDSANFGILVVGYGVEGAGASKVFEMHAGRTWADETATTKQSATASSDERHSTFSTWINTTAGSPEAPLSLALAACASYLEPWVRSHGLAPPPYVINVTDGTFTDGDPAQAAKRVKVLSTFNGPVVVWTCQLTDDPKKAPVLFPTDGSIVGEGNSSRALFLATSELPRDVISNLMMEFPEVSKVSGARAAIFDADLKTLVRFVSFVTRVPLP